MNFFLLGRLQGKFIDFEEQLEIGIIKPELKGMIEHHEEDNRQLLVSSEVEYGNGRKKITPIYIATILEIENLIKSIELLFGVVIKLNE